MLPQLHLVLQPSVLQGFLALLLLLVHPVFRTRQSNQQGPAAAWVAEVPAALAARSCLLRCHAAEYPVNIRHPLPHLLPAALAMLLLLLLLLQGYRPPAAQSADADCLRAEQAGMLGYPPTPLAPLE
jgi:hypothetical protein